MKLAAIYDIHGNLPALEAVFEAIRQAKVDQVIVGGDVVPGPMSREALEFLIQVDVPTQFILGNTDREVLAQMTAVETSWFKTAPELWRAPVSWAARQLHDQHARMIAGWPATCRMEVAGLGDVLFCHATPRNDTEVFTRLTAEDRLWPVFAELDVSVVVCGHTHMQFDRMVGGTRVVNAGSVGMPFGEPGAYWLLLGPEIQLCRTLYDLPGAAKRIATTDYPQAADYAADYILQPPSEEQMLDAYGKAELTTE